MEHGRLPWPRPRDLDEAGRAVYEHLLHGPRAGGVRAFPLTDDEGRLHGPFNAMVLAPSVGDALQELGGTIRYRTSLSPRAREIAILTVAVHHGSTFETWAHTLVGARVGLAEEELADLRAGRVPTTCSDEERLVAGTVTQLLTDRALDDDAFAAARDRLGITGVLELCTLVGYYQLLDLILSVAETPLPEGMPTDDA